MSAPAPPANPNQGNGTGMLGACVLWIIWLSMYIVVSTNTTRVPSVMGYSVPGCDSGSCPSAAGAGSPGSGSREALDGGGLRVKTAAEYLGRGRAYPPHPMANLFMKQMKSLTFRTGGDVERSQFT